MRLLDLFCGAGGAAVGYSRAGFDEIVGVDIKPQPRYPFTFVQHDALDFVKSYGAGFDAIHASPPCQGYSIMRNLPWLRDREYPMLIPETRRCLEASGRPFIIENVAGARRSEKHPEGLRAFWLCGSQVGLPIFRHRYFETSWFWMKPPHAAHTGVVRPGRMLGSRARDHVAWANGFKRDGAAIGHHCGGVGLARESMGIDWMRRVEINQAIPPAYTEFIGKQLLEALRG
jgi:DNA (cytosine-5)-methyltransferase 1